MKTTISHLPENKQVELNKAAQAIKDICSDVQMIILFGSYARGNYKEEKDLKPNRKSGHVSDYDILVITEKHEAAEDDYLWGLVSKKLKRLELSASPRIIVHDIAFVNKKLGRNQYFFSDIRKEGCMLYDSAKFHLLEVQNIELEELKELAQSYFKEWFESAQDFFKGYEFYFSEKRYKKAAFSLHQAAESAYKTILLVFTNYCPLEHCLVDLKSEAVQYNSKLGNIFENTQEKRFKLLNYAYIGARYDINYKIEEDDLEYLSNEVRKLLEITKEICQKKIASF